MEIQQLERAFRYNSVDLIDPGAQYTPEQVRDFYSPTYPEILNAAIEGPEEKDNKLVYTFRRAVGTKGSTKENPGAFDCYTSAAPDEPLFVLLARDKHAPTLIWLWAVLRELDGEDTAKVNEARDCAMAMVAWASAHGRKSVGLGQAALAGSMELVRIVNAAVRQANLRASQNEATPHEIFRFWLAQTNFEAAPGARDFPVGSRISYLEHGNNRIATVRGYTSVDGEVVLVVEAERTGGVVNVTLSQSPEVLHG